MSTPATLDGDSRLWWLHDCDLLGRFLPVAGALLLGVGLLRRHVLPAWSSLVVILAALVCLGFNAQTERVLLAVPLGLAWIAHGA